MHGYAVLGTAKQCILRQHCTLWPAGCTGGVQDKNRLTGSVFDFGEGHLALTL